MLTTPPSADSSVVHTTGNETIAGVKTFSSQPVLPQALTRGTTVASTSGTAIDFTGIPSWVNRITVAINNVSKNASGALLLQLGTASGVETTGYSSTSTNFTGSVVSTAGFIVGDGAAAWLTIGIFTLVHMGSNVWVCSFSGSLGSVSATFLIGTGNKTLAAVLDRVRITTSTGTDTFDAGSINILYE
jgi:hypothetical protein